MTSKSSPDSWLDKAEQLIRGHGGKVLSRAYGSTAEGAAYLLAFEYGGDRYKIVWPVLPTRRSPEAARIQATTLMFHDIKAKLLSGKVIGFRPAFFSYLMLPDGRVTTEVAMPDLAATLPDVNRPLLPAGDDALEGEWKETD
jgi:hypothetical protein